MEIARGDLVTVDLDPVKGSEQGRQRPCLVIQNDTGNKHSPATIVAAITSKYGKVYPVNVELEAGYTGLDQDSVVLLNQIRTVSIKHRVDQKIGELSDRKMEEVDRALEISLGLE